MKIVILDSYTANPGDLSFADWCDLGEVEVYDRTSPGQLLERAKDAEALLTNKVVIDAEAMEQLPALRYIGVLATGYNVVDALAAKQRGIVVTNVPAYSTASVAQMVFAHLLNVTNNVATHAKAVREGLWQTNPDFCFWLTPQQELAGKVFGIVGLGNTGMAAARIAQAFGMQVVAYSSKSAETLGQQGIRKAESYETLFAEADVLSLHCPLTPDTHHLVCADRLSLMKPSAILINTGRGPLVDEVALAEALEAGRLQAACLDVLAEEPPRKGSPLLSAPNCHITPHIAWATREARQRLLCVARENLHSFLSGHPQNQILNP